MHRREVDALVGVSLGGGAVTEGAERDRAFASKLGRVGDTGRFRNPARHHLGDRGDLERPVAVTAAGDVAARGKRIGGLSENCQHPLPYREPPRYRVGKPAIVGYQPVVRSEGRGGSNLDAFVPAARPDKWRAALLDQ